MDLTDLAPFLDRFRQPAVIREIAARAGLDPDGARVRLDTYLNEVAVGLDLVRTHLRPGMRVLEVGAGLGLLSLYLRSQGVAVTAIEPVGRGYDFWRAAAPVIRAAAGESDLPFIPCGAEALEPARHGSFDLIFSVHVLEHVADLPAAFAGMSRVLAPGGTMVHLCPNYRVPYEPHFSRPLLPRAPRLSRAWMGPVDRMPGVWESLNFISAGRVRRLARAQGLTVRFERGLLADALQRLGEDPEFARRHAGSWPVRAAAAIARLPGMAPLLRRVPAALATPMRFELRRA